MGSFVGAGLHALRRPVFGVRTWNDSFRFFTVSQGKCVIFPFKGLARKRVHLAYGPPIRSLSSPVLLAHILGGGNV